MAHVLIIDDDQMICSTISNVVKQMGHDVTCTFTLQDGLTRALSGDFDVVFLDVRMPDGNGLDALPHIREAQSLPEVIIITGFGDPDGAELAIKSGAWDYIEKPSSAKAMMLTLSRVLQYREEKKAKKPRAVLNREGIVGENPPMKACLDLVAQAATSEANVFITGETGTGKELLARAIHRNSPRADGNFVVVDCAALPETLVESIIFGHERGAFTGADRAQDGLIKQADRGTLFLDEVGELPLSTQSSFLRALQEHRFRPIGSSQEIESRFRLITATNQDIEAMVERDRFRSDLLFRLRTILIELPPLRKHPEDIKDLAMHHMAKLCGRYGIGIKGFSPEFFDALNSYTWPGNVRELINALESALSAAYHEPTLYPWHLPTHIRIQLKRSLINKTTTPTDRPLTHADPQKGDLPTLRGLRNELEQRYLQDLISTTGGDIQRACQISGLSRSRLYAILKKHKISIPS